LRFDVLPQVAIILDKQTFLQLSLSDLAALVRRMGAKVCVFPINGTRRWFVLEYPEQARENFVESYLKIGGQRHLDIYQLLFDHGIDTLVTPVIGPDVFKRGADYHPIIADGLRWFAENPAYLAFYEAYDVRVRVYGDTERYLRGTPYEVALNAFDFLAQRTAHHQTRRLFFGVCAHDSAETVAQIGVQFHQQHGRLPEKREIVEAYYGEYIDPVSFFIGFDRLSVFDMPLIASGHEDLYFTVSPSLYLTEAGLRDILYDHLFARRIREDYEQLTPHDFDMMAAFYRQNQSTVLGIGAQAAHGNLWYPTFQLNLPDGMADYLRSSSSDSTPLE
jgi:tuberculosinol/isotuberculosinol synthase